MKQNDKVLVYAHHGEFNPWVISQINAFIQRSYRVIVSTTNPSEFPYDQFPAVELLSRINRGWDIGAWSRVLSDNPDIFDSNILVLMNDSCIGPIQSLDPVFESIEAYDYDIWGLTDNIANGQYHLQSYMRAFSSYALENHVLQEALCPSVTDVQSLDKFNLVMKYEVRFPLNELVNQQGNKLKVMYSYKDIVSQRIIDLVDDPNQYIYAWERLLTLGYPFVKKSLFTQFKVMAEQDVNFIKRIYGVDLGGYL